MSQIIIDTNDDVKVLAACRNMLSELIGEGSEAPAATVEKVIDEQIHSDERITVSGTTTGDGGEYVVSGAAGAAAGVKVDMPGVAFNAEFCGVSEVPFYASGKRKGQWKKRRGVTDEAYDAWYASQPKQTAADTSTAVDTAGAFGADSAPTPDADKPADCGAFMGWVSAKQAAGLLTQEDIGAAYTQAGVQVTDLFPPNDSNTVARHVGTLYTLLVDKAGA